MTTITPRTLELRINTEHLNDALQQYFGRYGYVQDDEFFEVQILKKESKNMYHIVGRIVDNG